MAVVEGEDDPQVLARLKRMGINTIVTSWEPSLKTALATQAAGLSYLAFISAAEALRLAEHPESLARVRPLRRSNPLPDSTSSTKRYPRGTRAPSFRSASTAS